MKALWSSRHPRQAFLPLIAMVVMCGEASAQQAIVPTARYPILKRHVQVIETPAQDFRTVVGEINPDDGLVASAAFSDLAKAFVARSGVFRIVEQEAATLARSEPSLKLNVRFVRINQQFHVFASLLAESSGGMIGNGHGTGTSLEKALETAIGQVERAAISQPWRCRVLEVRDGKVLIDRGRLDGLAEGQVLAGYRLAHGGQDTSAEPTELTLLKHGKPAGDYEVVEVKEEYSALKPREGENMLKPLDIVEAPGRVLYENQRSGDSLLWDTIYGRKQKRSAKTNP